MDTIDADGGKLRLKRQTDTGWEIVEAQTPCVLTITNDEHNLPRIPKVRDVMLSYRAPLTELTLDELGIDATATRAGNAYSAVADLVVPDREINCEFVAGDTLDEKVADFARRIAQTLGG